MVHVFTHKRFLGERKVIYEPEDYFKTRVVESVRQGLYELSAEAKALIASEGVTKLEKDSITTKYGDMKLEDISWLSKMLIVMEFMHDLSYDEVINITHNGQHLESLLKQAEKYGIDVFMSFQFCSESWRHINVAVRFNGDLMEHRMGDMLINIACDFAPCNGIESETRLQFTGVNAEYNLYIPTSRLTLTVDNSFQMKKFMDDLQKAVENGSIQVTGTKADTYADFEISPQQILIATKDNVDYIVQKLRSSNQGGYIVIYKYCEAVYSALRGIPTRFAVYTITLLCLVTAENIFDSTRHNMVNARHTICRWWSLIEDKCGRTLSCFDTFVEGILLVPLCQNLIGKSR